MDLKGPVCGVLSPDEHKPKNTVQYISSLPEDIRKAEVSIELGTLLAHTSLDTAGQKFDVIHNLSARDGGNLC